MPDQPMSSLPAVSPEADTLPHLGTPPAAVGGAPAPDVVGRYTVLELHATGGLGEVYLARDEELGREVALKRIQGRHAGHPDSARRFLQEAEITARLEHPAVVPVHGLVRDADGRPCYAMRFLRGDTLTDSIRKFHEGGGPCTEGERGLAFRGLLQRFVAVCQAVAYAHSRGVIHRDLKPHNVMLGDFGETLVIDWGLAKPVGRSEEQRTEGGAEATLRPTLAEGGSETVMGSARGTPAYMSPEQAAGRWDAVGPASDVYSLGATLYHLLTGRPPFTGDNVHAIRERVIAGEYAPPRQANPAVPAALAAVCAKAMARKPEGRYATAKELAADVEHWLADEPVSAYREPLPARARRWLRRHRSLTTGVAAALVAAVVALSAGLALVEAQKRETKRQQEIAVGERDAAKEQRLRTRAALDDMLSEESLDWLKAQKELLPQQRAFLERALTYYQEFAREEADDEAGRALVARASFRVGRNFQLLGRPVEAEGPYRAARDQYRRLADDFPAVPGYRSDLARTRNSIGRQAAGVG
jgi:serine/threonine-protein kinase